MTQLPYIDKQIQTLAIPINSISPDPVNAKDHPQSSIDGIAASLREFGQTKPIIVRKDTGIVVCGNGTYLAAKQLGWTHIAANVREMDAVTATKLAIVDNRSSELGAWKPDVLSQLLPEISFDDPVLTEMMEKLQKDLELPIGEQETTTDKTSPDQFPQVDENIETQYCCPKCQYRWSGKPA